MQNKHHEKKETKERNSSYQQPSERGVRLISLQFVSTQNWVGCQKSFQINIILTPKETVKVP